jgi:hypothetical protein
MGAGHLSLRAWIHSLRGIDEAAWFARDDLAPFFRMLWQLARRALRRMGRDLATAVSRIMLGSRRAGFRLPPHEQPSTR